MTEVDRADRFLTAWKRLERCLYEQRNEESNQRVNDDIIEILTWAWRTSRINTQVYSFLDRCRQARNAYAHVVFDGYEGPVTLPPAPVVERLERIAGALAKPPKVTAVSVKARVCRPETPVLEALAEMRVRDFSQLPYLDPSQGWRLITRDQIARWVEASAEVDAACLLDLTQPVAGLAGLPSVGAVIPRLAPRSMLLSDAVAELTSAFETPDHESGGYPVLLVLDSERSSTSPELFAADDLPRAYHVLGR